MLLKNNFIIFISCIVLQVLVTPNVFAEEEWKGQMASQEMTTQLKADGFLNKQRKLLIDDLLKIASNNNSKSPISPKAFAIYHLGNMKAEEAIPFFIAHIDEKLNFVPGFDFQWFGTSGHPGENYASSIALAKIGVPAIKPLIKCLFSCETQNKRDISLSTLQNIFRLRLGNKTSTKILLLLLKNELENEDLNKSELENLSG